MDETEDGHPASCLIRMRTVMVLNIRIDLRKSLMPRQLRPVDESSLRSSAGSMPRTALLIMLRLATSWRIRCR